MTYFTYNGRSSADFGLHIEKKDASHNTHRLNVEEMKQLLLKLKLFGGTC